MKRELSFKTHSEILDINKTTEAIIGAAVEVHRHLGPGLLESAYEECLCWELRQERLEFQQQLALPIIYKGLKLGLGYRLDIVVERKVVVEVKSVEKLVPIHSAQLLTYLKLSGIGTGLLMNFNTPFLKDGVKRMVLGPPREPDTKAGC